MTKINVNKVLCNDVKYWLRKIVLIPDERIII